MVDKTRDDTNAQKRSVSVAVAPLAEADILGAGSVYVNLPERSVVRAAGVLVSTASGTLGATVDILIGGTVVANEVPVDATGMIDGVMVSTAQYFATGGAVTVRAGAVPPADGAFVGELVLEYVELDKKTGEYTAFTAS